MSQLSAHIVIIIIMVIFFFNMLPKGEKNMDIPTHNGYRIVSEFLQSQHGMKAVPCTATQIE